MYLNTKFFAFLFVKIIWKIEQNLKQTNPVFFLFSESIKKSGDTVFLDADSESDIQNGML
ncbi:hypothetical protein BpHYR1_031932 [Brachionus plicatilis]|uniref:Uncharacterized protein n=1 Tax=Brachionus plicatilis TaxID=10195 RepID=A0A3M7QVP5_BRAPC|nr:hypothetical protein BpHYR1_031932 [Brachionus plicatilis]